MKTHPSIAPTTYHLENDRTLRVVGRHGDRLRVIRGRVWLSEESLASDRIVDAGEERALVTGEATVIQALGATIVAVERTAAPPARWGSLRETSAQVARAASVLRTKLHLGADASLTIAP